jgi:hypothetical protein
MPVPEAGGLRGRRTPRACPTAGIFIASGAPKGHDRWLTRAARNGAATVKERCKEISETAHKAAFYDPTMRMDRDLAPALPYNEV